MPHTATAYVVHDVQIAAGPSLATCENCMITTAEQASASPAATASSTARLFPAARSPATAATSAPAPVTAAPAIAPAACPALSAPWPCPGADSARNATMAATTGTAAAQDSRPSGRPDQIRTTPTATMSSAATISCTVASGPERSATA